MQIRQARTPYVHCSPSTKLLSLGCQVDEQRSKTSNALYHLGASIDKTKRQKRSGFQGHQSGPPFAGCGEQLLALRSHGNPVAAVRETSVAYLRKQSKLAPFCPAGRQKQPPFCRQNFGHLAKNSKSFDCFLQVHDRSCPYRRVSMFCSAGTCSPHPANMYPSHVLELGSPSVARPVFAGVSRKITSFDP